MNKLIFWNLLIAVLILSSCSRRDLDILPAEGRVNITFDWANLTPGEKIPTGMKLYFYGNGTVITKDCSGTGFTGTIPNGKYQMIAYNTDAIGVSYANLDSYANAQVVALPAKSVTYISQPQHAYGIGIGNITVTGCTVVNKTVKPISYIKSVSLIYKITGDINAIKSSTGSVLDGIAQAVNIVTGEPVGNTGTIESATTPLQNQSYASLFTFFGRVKTSSNMLQSYFNFVGGGGQSIVIDLSSSISGINQAIIPIDISVDINVTGTLNGGGFYATVTKWSSSNGVIIVQ